VRVRGVDERAVDVEEDARSHPAVYPAGGRAIRAVMSKISPDDRHRPGGPAPFQMTADGSVPEPEHDFADEHDSTSYASELSGGPEGAREAGSPHGHAGMDPA
jgi:hypothetical protein